MVGITKKKLHTYRRIKAQRKERKKKTKPDKTSRMTWKKFSRGGIESSRRVWKWKKDCSYFIVVSTSLFLGRRCIITIEPFVYDILLGSGWDGESIKNALSHHLLGRIVLYFIIYLLFISLFFYLDLIFPQQQPQKTNKTCSKRTKNKKTNNNTNNITAQSNGDGSVIVKGESCVLRRRTSVTQPSSTASEYRTERVTQVVLIRRRIRFYGFTTARHSILQATRVACSFIRHHHHL